MTPNVLARLAITCTATMFCALLVFTGDERPAYAELKIGDGSAAQPLHLPRDRDNYVWMDSARGSTWIQLNTNDDGKPLARTVGLMQWSLHRGVVPEDEIRSVKIIKLTYTGSNGRQKNMDVRGLSTGGSVLGDHRVSGLRLAKVNAAIEATEAPAIDWTKPARFHFELWDAEGKPSEPDRRVKLTWRVSNDLGGRMWPLCAGPHAPIRPEGPDVMYLRDFLEARGLHPVEFVTPDLMFYSHGAPRVGEIRFIPIGPFSFATVPERVHAFDRSGKDLLESKAVRLGEPRLADGGELAVPVKVVGDEVGDLAMMVRGVELAIAENHNSTLCYTVGGSSFKHILSMGASIGDAAGVNGNWEGGWWSEDFSVNSAYVPVWDKDSERVVDQSTGRFPVTVPNERGGGYISLSVSGYLENDIRPGTIFLRPLHGFKFLEDERTKVYVTEWREGERHPVVAEGTISVVAKGSVVIDLDRIESYSNRNITVAVVNLRVSHEPIGYGDNLLLNVYGSALRAPLKPDFQLFEGHHPDDPELVKPLPNKPSVSVHGWTPAAVMKE